MRVMCGVWQCAYVLSGFVLLFLRQTFTIVHGNLKFCFYDFGILFVWFVSIGTELYLRYNPQQFRDRPKCYKRLSSGNPFIHETVAMISFVTHAKSHMNDKEHKLQKYLSRFNKYTILGYLSCGVFHFFCS